VADVEQLCARFTQRFPELMMITGRVVCRQAGPGEVAGFIGQTYRIADPALRSIPRAPIPDMTRGALGAATEN
jgi:hypothetical protein